MPARQSLIARRARLLGSAACAAAATLLVSGCQAEREPQQPSRVQLAAVFPPLPQVAPLDPVRITLPDPTPAPFGPYPAPAAKAPALQAAVPVAALDAAPLQVAAPIALAVRPPIVAPGLEHRSDAAPAAPEPVRVDRLAAVQPQVSRRDERAFVPQITDTVRTAYIAQLDVESVGQRLAVRSGRDVLGAVEFQVADGRVSVHIGQVLELFEGQMDAVRFAHLRGSAAAQGFVSLERLQDAGIPLGYDPVYDELVLQPSSG